jgi:N-acetylmuramoyl-L-alanine amidase
MTKTHLITLAAIVILGFVSFGQATELIVNGGFESGLSSWTAFWGTGIQATLTTYPHTGLHYAYLTGNNSSGGIYQNVTIPANASIATLSFWWNVSSEETSSTTIYDDFYVILYDSSGINQLAHVKTLSNLDKGVAGAYQQVIYDLMAYRGLTISLRMNGQNDATLNTTFRIDDVSVSVTTATCSYSLNPYSASPGSDSGSGSFNVIAGSGCTWSASSDATSWLHTNSSGSGNGTVNYTYDANPNTTSRIGHIIVGGQTFTVTQIGGGITVPITQDFIPVGRNNRPAYPLTVNYITIHDTDNTTPGANALMHANYLKNPDQGGICSDGSGMPNNPDCPKSWHFTVDDHEIYQHLPLNENGWHAGDGLNGPGNRQSIGIEICMNSDGNRAQAEENAAWLTAKVLNDLNLSLDRVKQHNYWSGKNCPSVLRGRIGGWEGFLARVAFYMGQSPPTDTTLPMVNLTSPNSGTFTVGSQMTISATASDASGISRCAYSLVKGGSTVLGIIYQNSDGDGMVTSYNWTIPATFNGYTINGTDYQIFVAAWDASPNHNSNGALSSGYITLQPVDTMPDQFTFTAQTGVALNTTITSNTITVSGINAAASITITGGTYSINGGAYTSATGTVNNGNTVTVRQTSSCSYLSTTNATLTIGGVSGTFSVTTQSAPVDITPPAITITSPLNNATVTSANLPVSGMASDSGCGNNGVSSVTVNGVSASGGTVSGSDTAYWNATITLSPGANPITVVAKDTLNNSSQQQITVTYTPPDTEPVLSPMTVDLNHDGIVNFIDFAILANHWMDDTCSEPDWCEGSDFDKNGIVDIDDLQIFTEFWLWPVADIDMDGAVNFTDYAIFANHWMDDTCCDPNWCEGTDFDHSGSVDMLDLATFVGYWLEGN